MVTIERWSSVLGLRPGERRRAALAFSALFVTMLGHSALETARDALFLEHLDADRLAWAYFAIATVALGVGQASLSAGRRFGPRMVLPMTMVVGAGTTLLFWLLLLQAHSWAFGAFYVWVGVFASAAVTQLWLRISDLFHVGQAKRIYGFIGSGALLGAFAGSALSAVVLSITSTSTLVPLGAGAFIAAAGLGLSLGQPSSAPPQPAPMPTHGEQEPVPKRERRYARRLALSVFVGSALFTAVDLVFKSTVAQQIPAEQLGAFFARTYAALNLAALIVQLIIAPKLLRGLGVHWTSMVLPLLLILSGLGLLVFGGLFAALLAKGADGVLRHGLHKTSTEILYMPLSSPTRARLKAFTEVLSQRAGQAATAGASLAAAALGAPALLAGAVILLIGAGWLLLLRSLQRDYLGLFRRHLRAGLGDAEVPELDLGALETLIAALSAEDDQEVIGALEWLSAYARPRLVPALILLHPSKQVALRAFRFFDVHPSPDALRVAKRRCADPDPSIRAAALHLMTRHSPDEAALEAALQDASPVVQAEGLTLMIARGAVAPDAASTMLLRIVEQTDKEGAVAVARALASLPPKQFSKMACHLVRDPEPEVLIELARALAENPALEYIEPLLRLLGRRPSRAAARRALVGYGPTAVQPLLTALDRDELPWSVRRQIPDTLVAMKEPQAAQHLLTWLAQPGEDRAVSTAIRALSRQRSRRPDIPLDRGLLLSVIDRWLRRSVSFLHAHVAVRCVIQQRPQAHTAIADLLITLLEEKEAFALEHVFMLLHILSPQDGFVAMHEALLRRDPAVRASTRELLTHLVPAKLRVGINALTEDVSDSARMDLAANFYEPPTRARLQALEPSREGIRGELLQDATLQAYRALLGALSAEPSEALRALIASHQAELLGGGKTQEPPMTPPEHTTPAKGADYA